METTADKQNDETVNKAAVSQDDDET